jgi:hypothetical protein
MTTPRHTYGTLVTLESSETRTLAWSCVVSDGVTTYTLDSVDVADPVLTADSYSPEGFIAHVAKKLRQSLFDRLDGMAETQPGAGGTRPTAAGDLDVELGFPDANLVAGVNTSKLELWFDATPLAGAATANGALSLTSVSLVNTNGVWSKTGLCTYGETRTVAASGGAVTITGRFQPRWWFCFRASRRDTGDYQEKPSVTSELMGDKSAFTVVEGVPVFSRDIAIVNQRQNICGPPYVVGRFSAFGASRRLLDLQTYDETLFRGMTGTYKRTANLSEGQYLFAGDWWARYAATSGDQFQCYDVWPSTKTPYTGEPIQVLSEVEALIEEWLRVGLLFVYEPNDEDGSPTWISKAYAPRVQSRGGALQLPHQRRDAAALYTMNLSGFWVPNPGLATP